MCLGGTGFTAFSKNWLSAMIAYGSPPAYGSDHLDRSADRQMQDCYSSYCFFSSS
jgi:hypothetical protein